MSYIDGFVIACPTANKDKFIAHARLGDSMFIDLGARRVVECWGGDVKRGQHTDFFMAVQAKEDETVLFSWIEWPDKAMRDACFAQITEWMENPENADPRMDPEKNPMPFDGKRMIFGGFEVILDTGKSAATGYIDGFVIAVPNDKEAAYRKMAEGSAPIFMDLGATRVVECWGNDVPKGEVTDFQRAVKASEDETIVFSWIEYPDKATRDKADELMMSDPRFAALGEMPFDGKRMIYSGFAPIVDLRK
jgi:uncharacterized protein YbaA (DUF1428 family)